MCVNSVYVLTAFCCRIAFWSIEAFLVFLFEASIISFSPQIERTGAFTGAGVFNMISSLIGVLDGISDGLHAHYFK